MSPPPPGMAGAGVFSGLSATTASVVRNNAPMLAAFCSAERVTLVGSITPNFSMSPYSPVAAFKPCPGSSARTFSTMTPPSRPAFAAICLIGSSSARRTMCAPVASSPSRSPLSRAGRAFPAYIHLVERGLRVQQGHAAAGHDALLDGRPRGLHGVLDAVLLLLELDLGGRADLDHRDAAGQARQALLQLLAVVVRVRLLDLGLD